MVLGEKRKIIAFNLEREYELYELASQINFSAFVKRALLAELKRQRGERHCSNNNSLRS